MKLHWNFASPVAGWLEKPQGLKKQLFFYDFWVSLCFFLLLLLLWFQIVFDKKEENNCSANVLSRGIAQASPRVLPLCLFCARCTISGTTRALVTSRQMAVLEELDLCVPGLTLKTQPQRKNM